LVAFGSAVAPTHLCVQWVPWALASGLNGGGVDFLPPCSAEWEECVELYFHRTACLHGTHSGNFTFTLLVMACDILQHVVGRVGPSVVGCPNLRLSGESYTTMATSQYVVRIDKHRKQNMCR